MHKKIGDVFENEKKKRTFNKKIAIYLFISCFLKTKNIRSCKAKVGWSHSIAPTTDKFCVF